MLFVIYFTYVSASRAPFNFRFLTDGWEFAEGVAKSEGANNAKGFRVAYIGQTC